MIATAIDVILCAVIVEGVALSLLHLRGGRGPSPRALLPNLAAGFFLMAGVRLALLAGTPGGALQAALAGVLLLALIAHLVDLAARWPSEVTARNAPAPARGRTDDPTRGRP